MNVREQIHSESIKKIVGKTSDKIHWNFSVGDRRKMIDIQLDIDVPKNMRIIGRMRDVLRNEFYEC